MSEVLPIIFALLATATNITPGWLPVPGLPGSRANPKGWALIWIAVLRGAGYEQPAIVEAPGAMVVVKDAKGRVAFIKQHRVHRPRLAEALSGADGLGYVALLARQALWGRLMESHAGSILFELPAGLVDAADIKPGLGYEDLVRLIGKREVKQETGFQVRVDQVFLDGINPNPVFFLHAQNVVVATLEAIGEASPDPEEAIKGRFWLTPEEVKANIRDGHIIDSRTVHALYLAGVLN